MMTLDFLGHLRELGVRITVDAGELRCRAPRGVLTPELLSELRQRKSELLPYFTPDAGAGPAAAATDAPIPRIARGGELPLSFGQQRLWFLDQLLPGNPAYNVCAAATLSGALDVVALQQSLTLIAARHETLRTILPAIDGRPSQVVLAPAVVPLPVTDLSGENPAGRSRQVRQIAGRFGREPFALGVGPLFRTALIRLGASEHVLLFSMHHAVTDGWSLGILVRELAAAYPAFASGATPRLPELAVQYADYSEWQRQRLSGATLDRLTGYWRRQLDGAPGALPLGTRRAHPIGPSDRGAKAPLALSAALTEALIAFSHREGLTIFMTMMSALAVLLARYTGERDVPVGFPVANRVHPQIEPLIGFFANTLVLRQDLGGRPTFRALTRRVRELTLDALTHQDLPFDYLTEILHPDREVGANPLFQVMFAMQSEWLPSVTFAGLRFSPASIENHTAKVNLNVTLAESAGRLQGWMEYRLDLFEPADMRRMASHLVTLLTASLADPDRPIHALPLLGEAERRAVTSGGAAPRAAVVAETLDARFDRQAARTPSRLAVVSGDTRLTYGELHQRASALAARLRARGVGPDVPVALHLERSADLATAILATWKAGGAYLPLDPSLPAGRIAFMLQDARPAVILTQRHLLPDLAAVDAAWDTAGDTAGGDDEGAARDTAGRDTAPRVTASGNTASVDTARRDALNHDSDDHGTVNQDARDHDTRRIAERCLCLDDDLPGDGVAPVHAAGAIAAIAAARVESGTAATADTADRLAYLIYTSGSTGQPKAVAISHRSAVNLVHGLRRAIYDDLDRPAPLAVGLNGPLIFDTSVKQIVQLTEGHTLHILPDALRADPQALLAHLREQPLDLLDCTPSQLRLLIAAGLLDDVRTAPLVLLIGGEAIDDPLWERLAAAGDRRFYNLYGPTECTVDATACRIGASPFLRDGDDAIATASSAAPSGLSDTDVDTDARADAAAEAAADAASRGTHVQASDRNGGVPSRRASEAAAAAATAATANGAPLPASETGLDCLPAIGRPLLNVRAYVLDREGEPLPIGAPGELHIGGAGVGRGYVRRPGLTASLFVPDPFADAPGARMYRTRDVARWRTAGDLEFLGRVDRLVKLRGRRIELQEIEAALCRHPRIRQAAVIVREPQAGDARLCAYVAAAPPAPRATELQRFLRDSLPAYMVPAEIVLLDALPATATGKVDYQRLPAPAAARADRVVSAPAPRDRFELELVRIWEELLQVRPIGVTDNFFDLGGHSFLAVMLIARIAQRLGRDVPLAALFRGATIEQLAAVLRQTRGASAWSSLVTIQAEGTRPPFFCVHPVGGNVLCYAALAEVIGRERPFHGLQAAAVDASGPDPAAAEAAASIETMAARYVAEIRRVRPHGPYHLGGWSMGGCIAFEMARQLQASGERIARLALIDSRAPGALRTGAPATERLLLTQFASDLAARAGGDADRIDPLIAAFDAEGVTGFVDAAIAEGLLPPGVSADHCRALVRTFMANIGAEAAYRPAPAPLAIAIWQSEATAARWPDEPFMGWAALADGGVTRQVTPGDHYSIMRRPHVEALAVSLAASLADADVEAAAEAVVDASADASAGLHRDPGPVEAAPHTATRRAAAGGQASPAAPSSAGEVV